MRSGHSTGSESLLVRYLRSVPHTLLALTLILALTASALAAPPASALTAPAGEIERAINSPEQPPSP